ncbi:TOBE domain-containing protein, partial [Bacillus vallismortis]|nr:TOBE domain-containing protein [Bacillus vallismortis]
AKINVAELLGSEIMIYSQIDHQEFIARIEARLDIQSGDELTVAFDMNKVHFCDSET